MRRALLVLYYFPPSGGPGVQRGLKFIRYLPEFGWEPLVLTVRADAQFPVRDESLLREIPDGLTVRRTRCPEFYGLYRALTRQPAATSLDITSQSTAEEGALRRLLRWLRATLLIPDGRAAWRPYAVRAGMELIRAQRPDLIFSSGPPFTAHLIGRDLRRRSGLPWVADYRDPWIGATFYPSRPRCAHNHDRRLEASCVRAAERTVVVGPAMAAQYRERYRQLDPERFAIIPNGYDEADFAGIPYVRPQEFRLTHSGSLFYSRTPDALLSALASLMEQEEGFREHARLCLAGRIDPPLERRLRVGPLRRLVELPGYLPHAESVRLLRGSSLLLLLVGADAQARSMLTGKVFEYLAAGVPILALGPTDGDAARLLAETGAGWTLPPDASDQIAAHLRDLWRTHREAEAVDAQEPLQFGLHRNEQAIGSYSRRTLTGRLAAIFDSVCV